MSDNKNDIDTDFEEKLAEIVGKKSRNRTNNNIYERFIDRVENGDEDYNDSDETEYAQQSNQTSENQQKSREVDFESTEDSFDFLDQETSVEEDTFARDAQDARNIDNDDRLTTQNSSIELFAEKAALPQNKLASSKKPLIIGMLLGSLLIVIVVAVLIFTGLLSPSAQINLSDAADTSTNSEVEAQTATQSAANVNTAPTAVDALPSADPNATNPPVITPQQARPTNDNQEVTANNVAQAPTAALDTVSNTEPAITYEDFREESQNTVYRETDD